MAAASSFLSSGEIDEGISDLLEQWEGEIAANRQAGRKTISSAAEVGRRLKEIAKMADDADGLQSFEITSLRKILRAWAENKIPAGTSFMAPRAHKVPKNILLDLARQMGVDASAANTGTVIVARMMETPSEVRIRQGESSDIRAPDPSKSERLIDPEDPPKVKQTEPVKAQKPVKAPKKPVKAPKKPAPPVPKTLPGGDILGLGEMQEAAKIIPTAKEARRGNLRLINLRLNGAMRRVGSDRAKEIKIATDALFRIFTIGVDPSKPGRSGKSILGFALPAAHLPGYNFCGPGTDVMGNLLAGRKPINKLDEACMEHDLQYLRIGTILNKAKRKEAVQAADAALIEESRRIASGPKSSLQEDATKVNGVMRAKALSGVSDFFLDLKAPPLEGDRKAAVKNLFLSLAHEGSDIAGNPERLEEVLPIVEPLGAAADPAPAAPTEAADEKKGDEEPTPGGVADGGASVSETAPVLPPEAAAAVAATIPQPQAPPRAAVQPVDEQGRATLPGAGAPPIVGERSMRPMAFRMEGDEVDLTDEQKRQNQLWLENFTWIDEGHGLGNQERLPWNLGGGKAKNSLFTAQQVNELIRLSGDLYNGDQEIREVPQVSKRTREIYRQPMISTNMRQQEFVRNGAMPAGRGRPIQMYRRTQTTPFAFRNARQTHLIHPDVVDGKRI